MRFFELISRLLLNLNCVSYTITADGASIHQLISRHAIDLVGWVLKINVGVQDITISVTFGNTFPGPIRAIWGLATDSPRAV